MATTTNYGWVTPDDTSLVKDGASAIRTLGTSADTTVKSLSPGTTAGDLDYYTAATTKARIGIGTNGQVLTSNGSVPAWATSSSFISILIPQNSTRWLNLLSWATGTDEANMTEDQTGYAPIFLSGIAFDRIGVRTGGSHTGTSTIRLGLYAASSTTGKPTTVYFDAGTVVCTVADTEYTITISQTPPAGYYFLAANVQTKTGNAFFYRPSGTTSGNANFIPTSSAVATIAADHRFTEASITGAFATAGTLSTGDLTTTPVIGLRIT